MRFNPTERIGVIEVARILTADLGWIVREQPVSDFGIDLHVEVCDNSNPTGRLIAIQVKSGKSFWRKDKKGGVVFPFDQSHYDYWTEHSLPVLLVLHNPESADTIWQHVCRKNCVSTGKGWKIRVPITQSLSPVHAKALFNLARRQSLQEAVKDEELRLRNLDRRFDVTVVATSEGVCTNFSPLVDVNLTFSLCGEPNCIEQKRVTLVERGQPVEFCSDEIVIKGSPIFERELLNASGKVTVQLANKRDVQISLIDYRGGAHLGGIPATIIAGTREFEISGSFPDSPVSILTQGSLENGRGTGSILFSPDQWYGRPVLNLPYFGTLVQFFKQLDDTPDLRLAVSIEGNKVLTMKLAGDMAFLTGGKWFVDLLAKGRAIAKHFGVNPIVPTLKMAHANEIELLYALLISGEVTTRVRNLRLSCTLVPNQQFLDSTPVGKVGKPFQIAVEYSSSPPLPLLGEYVQIGHQLTVATSVLLGNRDQLLTTLKAGGLGKPQKVTFLGTKDCKLIRKCAKVPLTTDY